MLYGLQAGVPRIRRINLVNVRPLLLRLGTKMADTDSIDIVLSHWLSRTHLLYLKRLRLLGHQIDDKRIENLEREVYPEAEHTDKQGGLLGQRDVDELQLLLSLEEQRPAVGSSIKVNLYQDGYTVLRMRPDPNHKLPHFHIEYKREYKTSYSIYPFQRLVGYVPPKYEKRILDWASTRLPELKLAYDKLMAGEDIRELVLIAEEA